MCVLIVGKTMPAIRAGAQVQDFPNQRRKWGIIPGVRHSGGDRGSEGYNMGQIVTRFTERFGCKHPFACAGLAFAGMTDLALAVCRGGVVGAIGVGFMPAPQLRAMIPETRDQPIA